MSSHVAPPVMSPLPPSHGHPEAEDIPVYSPRTQHAATLLEPFGEYAARVGGRTVDELEGKMISVVATLYLHRTDPALLQAVVQQWHRIHFPFGGDVDAFASHVLSAVQQTLEAYSACNWQHQETVVQLNTEYLTFMQTLLPAVLAGAPETPESPPPRLSRQSSQTAMDMCRLASEMATVAGEERPLPEASAAELRRIAVHGDPAQRVVVFFHAAFSQPSLEGLSVMARVRDDYEERLAKGEALPSVRFVVANCVTEVELVADFHIDYYPKVVMLLPPAPGAALVTACSLDADGACMWQGRPIVRYPRHGVRTVAAWGEWVRAGGTARVPLKRLKAVVTKARVLDARLRFAAKRELHSAVVMLRRLQCSDVQCDTGRLLTPADPPRFVFLGGGMAAGKTTAVRALAQEPWWQQHGSRAVIVDADEFKQNDPMFATGTTDAHTLSVQAAELLLVQAVNNGRDIVFDGTMAWRPYVEQAIAMVRNAHRCTYAKGRGYLPEEGVEEYFEPSTPRDVPLPAAYRIHIVGIFVDPCVAVPRALIRKLSTGRGVPVRQQLRSFRLFAEQFEAYADMCDDAVLYNNNVWIDLDKGELPAVTARKVQGGPLDVIDADGMAQFRRLRAIHDDAQGSADLFTDGLGLDLRSTSASPAP